ncbi:MAG: hypothetical protein JSW33_09225 [bacterium]|nr:MAG: hypothetical protein JSW33_09225 [bacterium]
MVKHFKIFSIIIALWLLFSGQPLFSQWYYSLYVEQEFNSNPFGIPEPQEDQISRFSMGLQKDGEKVSVQYFGSYLSYLQNSSRNFYWHQLYLGGGSEQTGWNIAAENRLNQETFDLYNYLTVRAGFFHALNSKDFLWRIRGIFSLNNFLQIEELNHLLFSASASLNRSFQTRTALIAAMAFNYKYYLEPEPAAEVLPDSNFNYLASVSSINQGPGTGHGSGDGGGNGFYYTSSAETPHVGQIFLSFRLAQSLTRSTGLAIQYQTRLNLNKYDRSIAGLIPGYTTESQIFDDPMSYEMQSFGTELTQILPYLISLKIAAYHQQKKYVAQGIYIDPENYTDTIRREDTFDTAWFILEKRFNFKLFAETSLAFQFTYQWVDNQSNSYWYDYNSHYYSVGLQLDM